MACSSNKQTDMCNCTASCEKHGKCCECVAYHMKKGQFPACFFSAEAEKTWDRSFSMLKKDRGGL